MKTVIHMAAECLLFEELGPDEFEAALVKFAELIRADEREACAKVCDVLAVHPEYASDVTKLAAAAIRARSNT